MVSGTNQNTSLIGGGVNNQANPSAEEEKQPEEEEKPEPAEEAFASPKLERLFVLDDDFWVGGAGFSVGKTVMGEKLVYF